mgnify:CR=1 FL=1|jgi:hypothetical protein
MDFDSDDFIDDNFMQIDHLDEFLFNYSDKIYYLYEDLKHRFGAFSPFFICDMQYHDLTNFFTDLVLRNPNLYVFTKTNLITCFDTFYTKELDISYRIVFNFAKQTLRFNLQYNDWLQFCYLLTDKYEMNK